MSKPGLSFGSDPEFMLMDRDGNLKSAIEVVRGGKQNKVSLRNGHKMFYDNVLCEFNVKPGYSEEEVLENFRDLFAQAHEQLYPFSLVPQASAIYPPAECAHPDASVFGCDPEYCAYDLVQLNPPVCEPGNYFRSAGGHIHLGYDTKDFPLNAPIVNEDTDDIDRTDRDWGRIWVVRMMDVFVGVPSLLIDHDQTSQVRRVLYGKSGSHRPQEAYGVEYRATGNFWLQSPKLTSLIYRLSAFTVDFVAQGLHKKLWKDDNVCSAYNVEDLRNAIDKGDRKLTTKLMDKVVKKYLPRDLYNTIFVLSEPRQYNFINEWLN